MKHRGFTLIELLLSIGMLAFVLTAIVSFTLTLTQARTKARVLSEIAYNARMIQDRLTDTARHAKGLDLESSVFGDDSGALAFTMRLPAEDPTLFSLTVDDRMQMQVGAASPQLLSSSSVVVSRLLFDNLTGPDDVGIVRVRFTLQAGSDSASPLYRYEESFQTTLRIPME